MNSTVAFNTRRRFTCHDSKHFNCLIVWLLDETRWKENLHNMWILKRPGRPEPGERIRALKLFITNRLTEVFEAANQNRWWRLRRFILHDDERLKIVEYFKNYFMILMMSAWRRTVLILYDGTTREMPQKIKKSQKNKFQIFLCERHRNTSIHFKRYDTIFQYMYCKYKHILASSSVSYQLNGFAMKIFFFLRIDF